MIVLDTNVVSEVGKPKPEAKVSAWFAGQDLANLYLCGPVVMEQAYGAEKFFYKTGSDRYLRLFENLLSRQFAGRVLDFDGSVPQFAGRLRATRESIGRPISLPDAMIASICLIHGATLATRNVHDFDGLDLKLVNPFEAGA